MLNDLGIMEPEYLWDKLIDSREYKLSLDGHCVKIWRCANYWICPLEKLVPWTYVECDGVIIF